MVESNRRSPTLGPPFCNTFLTRLRAPSKNPVCGYPKQVPSNRAITCPEGPDTLKESMFRIAVSVEGSRTFAAIVDRVDSWSRRAARRWAEAEAARRQEGFVGEVTVGERSWDKRASVDRIDPSITRGEMEGTCWIRVASKRKVTPWVRVLVASGSDTIERREEMLVELLQRDSAQATDARQVCSNTCRANGRDSDLRRSHAFWRKVLCRSSSPVAPQIIESSGLSGRPVLPLFGSTVASSLTT
mmetsp:Transcript_42052/g.68230  ORF Transcript_42052/g.68230 Transcript_42052/m.68230 type:complete len:244 (-) Transcript_42052:834-1565(-)